MKYIGTLEPEQNIVLMIAGNCCSPGDVYEKVTAPEGTTAVYLDYLGSEGPWDILSMAERVVQDIKNSNPRKLIVCAYSAGGVLAQAVACRIPDQIDGLLLSSTGPCTIGQGAPHFAEELTVNFDREDYMRSFFDSCFAVPIPVELEDRMWKYTRTIRAQAAAQVSASIRELDFRQELKVYHNPVRIVHGRLDKRRKMNAVEMLCESLPQAQVTLVQTGHTPMWEAADIYQNVLNELVGQII